MAYPVVDAPYGFKPINELNGLPYAGATRQFPIARNYNTALFNGDLVQVTATGTIIKTAMDAASSPGTAVAGQVGVFVGCSYTNPSTGQKLFAQYYPASTAANDIVAYVVDDPTALFKAVVVGQNASVSNTASSVGYFSQAFVGTNVYAITGTAGSTTTGNSKMAVSADNPTNGTGSKRIASTALPFRVVAVVPETGVVVTGTGTASNSTTITLGAAITGLQAGMQLIAPGGTGAVNPGDFNLVTNVNGTTVTVATAVTLSATPVTFVGYPEVLVKWNQGYHSYQFATAIA